MAVRILWSCQPLSSRSANLFCLTGVLAGLTCSIVLRMFVESVLHYVPGIICECKINIDSVVLWPAVDLLFEVLLIANVLKAFYDKRCFVASFVVM